MLTVLLQYLPAGLFHKIKGGSELPDDLGAEGDVLCHPDRYVLFDVFPSSFFLAFNSFKIINYFSSAASPSLSHDGASSTPIKVSLIPNTSHLSKFLTFYFR